MAEMDLFLLRPDLHIVWRSNALPLEPMTLALLASGEPVEGMGRHHLQADQHRLGRSRINPV